MCMNYLRSFKYLLIIGFAFAENFGRTNLCRSGRRLVAGGGESGETPVLLLLVNALPLHLWQLQEAVHGPQVDQQRLGGVEGILLLPQDLGQQALEEARLRLMLNAARPWKVFLSFHQFTFKDAEEIPLA